MRERVTRDIRLYDYQTEMKQRIETAFRSCRSVMVQMPTGTGKTYLLASVVYGEIRRSDNTNVWIVVHRRELVEQIEETLCKFDAGQNESSASNSATTQRLKNPRIKVMSIQWLSRHRTELTDCPSLIVIDEAHHAVAKTYAEVMNAYPEAKKLGVTATPCRLRKRGFTKLFDTLLMSWSTKRFIAAGRLSLYDYMSIKADSEDQRKVFGLTQRGADGDFSLKEMSEKLDVKPSIERLCDTILRYAIDKKGITYAIDIAHAEHIAEEYRHYGINAVAISSKTPKEERCTNIDRFKDGKIQVLVNVDLFGEGFDCPDVEFIQLARPTLSLSKYLQQVGRGMRVYDGKKYCLILDNVGLYRLFGLPSDDRDWQSMFEGAMQGKGDLVQAHEEYHVACSMRCEATSITSDDQTELITVMTHDGQRTDLEAAYAYEITTNESGLQGVADKQGNELLPCIYNKVELKAYGFARLLSRKKIDRERPWIDLLNGVRFVKRPMVRRCGFMEFSTTDGLRLYPRVRTRRMDETTFVTPDLLEHGIDNGLRFKNFMILPAEPQKLYSLKDKTWNTLLWEDEHGNMAWQEEFKIALHSVNQADWQERKKTLSEKIKDFKREVQQYIRHFRPIIKLGSLFGTRLLKDNKELGLRIEQKADGTCLAYCREFSCDKWKFTGAYLRVYPQAYGIRVVQKLNGKYVVRTKMFEPFETQEHEYDFAELQDNVILHFIENKSDYWVCLENSVCFSKKPEVVSIGFMNFLKAEDVYVEMSPYNRNTYRRDEIRARDGICFLGTDQVLTGTNQWLTRYYIHRRYADGRRFVLSDHKAPTADTRLYNMYYDGKNIPTICPCNQLDYNKMFKMI